jgi:pimeloyl-ACP methyl ester carboxylesterase
MTLPSPADEIRGVQDHTASFSSPKPEDELWHTTYNNDGAETIVLLHGLPTSHREWTLTMPHLSEYHLIIPDLNGHSNSRHILPATLPAQAGRVADLIRARAHGGQAHIVGMSMGGFVALEVARTCPDLVRSIFASGCAPFQGIQAMLASHPTILGVMTTGMNLIPSWMSDYLYTRAWTRQGLTISDDLKQDFTRNFSSQLIQEVMYSLSTVRAEQFEDVQVRILVVAGGQQDNIGATKALGAALKRGDPASAAAVVSKAAHPWDLQFPELFAECAKAWIEQRELPDELVMLD